MTQNSENKDVFTWRDEMHRQFLHGKHVLLYGNVDDRYILNDVKARTVLLPECLNHYFLTQEYTLVVHYDLADGLRTAIPEMMDSILLNILDSSMAGDYRETPSETASQNFPVPVPSASFPPSTSPVSFTSPVSTASSVSSASSSPISSRAEQAAAEFELASQKRRDSARSSIFTRRSEKIESSTENSTRRNSGNTPVPPPFPAGSTGAAGSSGTAGSSGAEDFQGVSANSMEEMAVPATLSSRSRSAEDVIPLLRRVLSQDRISAAVIIHFSDKLFDDTRRQSRAEREYLLHLKKILTEAATIHQGKLAGRRNALVLVASRLSAVPTWLYQEHPLLSLVRIPSPLEEERRDFIERFFRVFTRNSPLDEKQHADYVETFVEQTQGLALWDLMSLGSIANRSAEDPVDETEELRRLISLYRYGQKEDPWDKFNSGDRRNRIEDARASIETRVKGQPEAVNAIVEMLISATVGITMSPATRQTGKPKGVFFFVGPTGVGKTELAKALAELIFGDESRLRRFDMSEYTESHAAEKLTGSPPGYVGYEEGGQLTNFVRENPFSLLLFDEIEKAHGQVMDKFLQILEDGRLTDSKGQTAFFSQSVIIFTSNIGADSLFSDTENAHSFTSDSNFDVNFDSNQELNFGSDSSENSAGNSVSNFRSGFERNRMQISQRVTDAEPDYESFVKKHFLEKVREHFVHVLKRPEILNRFGDNIIVFDVLRPGFVRAIGEKFLSMFKTSAQERRGLMVEFEPSILAYVQAEMARPQNIKNGGRRIRTMLEDRLEKKFNRWIFEHQPAPGSILILGFNDDGLLSVKDAASEF